MIIFCFPMMLFQVSQEPSRNLHRDLICTGTVFAQLADWNTQHFGGIPRDILVSKNSPMLTAHWDHKTSFVQSDRVLSNLDSAVSASSYFDAPEVKGAFSLTKGIFAYFVIFCAKRDHRSITSQDRTMESQMISKRYCRQLRKKVTIYLIVLWNKAS